MNHIIINFHNEKPNGHILYKVRHILHWKLKESLCDFGKWPGLNFFEGISPKVTSSSKEGMIVHYSFRLKETQSFEKLLSLCLNALEFYANETGQSLLFQRDEFQHMHGKKAEDFYLPLSKKKRVVASKEYSFEYRFIDDSVGLYVRMKASNELMFVCQMDDTYLFFSTYFLHKLKFKNGEYFVVDVLEEIQIALKTGQISIEHKQSNEKFLAYARRLLTGDELPSDSWQVISRQGLSQAKNYRPLDV